MDVHKLLRWVISSIIAFVIVLLLINLVTGFFIDLSVEKTVPIIVSSIYDYASPSAQKPIVGFVDSICNSTDTQPKEMTTECLPQNQDSLRKICSEINTLPNETKQQYVIACQELTDGTLAQRCQTDNDVQTQLLQQNCRQLNAGQLSAHDFLISTLSSLLAQTVNAQLSENDSAAVAITNSGNVVSTKNIGGTNNPNIAGNNNNNNNNNPSSVLATVKKVINLVKESEHKYLGWKIAGLILMFILWYLISESTSDYVQNVSRMFFSAGMLIFAIWLVSIILATFFPPDTTTLLQTITGTGSGNSPQLIQLISLLPVIVLKLIGSTILVIACACISVAFLLYLIRRHFIDGHPRGSGQ